MKKLITAFIAAGAFVTVAMAAACGSDPTPTKAGGKCGADGDCDTGLKCLEYGLITAAGCQVNGKQCTSTCVTDDDCTTLNTKYTKNFKCQSGCTAGVVTCQ